MKTILVDANHTFVVDWIINQPMYELLETYPNPKIILTNANEEDAKQLWLINLPYPLFTLEHNPDKSDPKYYEIMLQQLNLNAKDVICFENVEESVINATSVGITTYHYDRIKKDIKKLKDFLDSNL